MSAFGRTGRDDERLILEFPGREPPRRRLHRPHCRKRRRGDRPPRSVAARRRPARHERVRRVPPHRQATPWNGTVGPDLPIIMLSAKAEYTDRVRASTAAPTTTSPRVPVTQAGHTGMRRPIEPEVCLGRRSRTRGMDVPRLVDNPPSAVDPKHGTSSLYQSPANWPPNLTKCVSPWNDRPSIRHA